MLSKNSDIVEDDSIIDTENLTNKTNKIITDENTECQEKVEFLEDKTISATGYLEMTNNETVDNEIIEHQV